jgi:hypothetical protein
MCIINKGKNKMQKNNWLVVGIIGIIALLFLFGGGMMMGGWGYHGWSMMGGPGGMMNNWGYAPSPLSWIGMFFMWLIPVGLIVLAVFGIVWLVRNISNSESPSS